MTSNLTKYEFRDIEGKDLPPWDAGAHIDIVVAPEFLRRHSVSGDPADRKVYQIGVLREDAGRGRSPLLHRIFSEGRKVFISRPIYHFQLVEDAERTFLMGGGIGITPMIAMAHRLHALGRFFEMHYSIPSRPNVGFMADLEEARWRERVKMHVSDEGTRADLTALLNTHREGSHVNTCGQDSYMSAVLDAAKRAGFPEDARHLEASRSLKSPNMRTIRSLQLAARKPLHYLSIAHGQGRWGCGIGPLSRTKTVQAIEMPGWQRHAVDIVRAGHAVSSS